MTDLTAVTLTLTDGTNTFYPALTASAFQQVVSLTEDKTYVMMVTATDEVGNQTTARRNIIRDTAPPGLTIEAITTLTNQWSQTVAGSREAGAMVTAACPTATAGAVTYPTETTWNVSFTGLSEGNNTLTVKAKDAAGNDTTLERQIVLDTAPPTAVISGLPGSPTNLTGATLNIAGADVIAYRYKLDSGSYSQETAASTSIVLADLADGSHTLSVIGKDAAGNWQAEETATTATWVVNTTPPVVQVTVRP